MQRPCVGIDFGKNHFCKLLIHARELAVEQNTGVSEMPGPLDQRSLPLFKSVIDAVGPVLASLLFAVDLGKRKQQVLRQLLAAEKAQARAACQQRFFARWTARVRFRVRDVCRFAQFRVNCMGVLRIRCPANKVV